MFEKENNMAKILVEIRIITEDGKEVLNHKGHARTEEEITDFGIIHRYNPLIAFMTPHKYVK